MNLDEDKIFKSLSNSARRDILRLLRHPPGSLQSSPFVEHGWSAGDIERQTTLSQSTISGHLSALQAAKLIGFRKVGQWRFYYRNEQALTRAQDLVTRILASE